MPDAYEVRVTGRALRDLQRLPEKVATAALEAFGTIAADARRLGKPLRWAWEGVWSARRGPYRVLYTLDDDQRTITIVAVDHRGRVYRHGA